MLPSYQSNIPEFNYLQSAWATQINPLIGNRLLNGLILRQVALQSGSNKIEHRLGRSPIGWLIIDSDANETAYRSAPFDPAFLTLTASGVVNVALYVF